MTAKTDDSEGLFKLSAKWLRIGHHAAEHASDFFAFTDQFLMFILRHVCTRV